MSTKNKKIDLELLGEVALNLTTEKVGETVAKTMVAIERTEISKTITLGISAILVKSMAGNMDGSLGNALDTVGDVLSVATGVSAISTLNKFNKNLKSVTDEDIAEFLNKYSDTEEK